MIAIPARDNLHARTTVSCGIGYQRQAEAECTFQGWEAIMKWQVPSSLVIDRSYGRCVWGDGYNRIKHRCSKFHASDPASVFIFLSTTHIATGSRCLVRPFLTSFLPSERVGHGFVVTMYTAVQAEQESRHSEAKGREAASNNSGSRARTRRGGLGTGVCACVYLPPRHMMEHLLLCFLRPLGIPCQL